MRADAPTSSVPSPAPAIVPGPRVVPREVRRLVDRDGSDEPIVELVVPRVIGPGRLERGYQARIERERERSAELERALELARLVERGAQRRLDRVETELCAAQRASAEARELERRLCAAIGALQRENALLAEELQRRTTARLPAPRRSLLARWLGRGR